MGLAIEGREMELLSFLGKKTSMESISNKENQFVDKKGRDQEGGSLFDGDMC